MTMTSSTTWPLLLFGFCVLLSVSFTASQDDRQSYIVYMGDLMKSETSIRSLHMNTLQKAIGSNFPDESLLHSFGRTFNGFVANLTEEEANKVAEMDEVVSVFRDQVKQLQTTKSWDFMGFYQNVQRRHIESDIIIGMLDSGLWPESESFNDTGFGPPPSKWKGICQVPSNFSCNNKVIGARYYRSVKPLPSEDIPSPRDTEGHGSHTSSTAAGNSVSMASLYGLGWGTARGGVPSARIAVYKICWADECYDSDILAAFDDAIADGVDIISLSVGGSFAVDYFTDSIAIGAFHAMRNGILTSNAAGNSGPDLGSVSNVSPWSISVAASTIERKFETQVLLGNNQSFMGVSINTFDLKNKMYPLIYGGDAPNITGNYTSDTSRLCYVGSLDLDLVKDKIVLCDALVSGNGPFYAGAAGAIMHDKSQNDSAYAFPLPVSYIDTNLAGEIRSYINSTSNPTSTIYKTVEVNETSAPYVVSFSSRGPNSITPDILKPDIAAPGVNILAAWSPIDPVSELETDKRFVPYNIISGTSMACPHVTGAAAYVKTFHPSWSPAAIKSALMTTAIPMSPKTSPEAELAYGAGHVNPVKAIDPGLIYDIEPIEYVKFLCGQGYNETMLRLVAGNFSTCMELMNETVWGLNYPSFALSTSSTQVQSRVFNRVVTNVGSPMAIYKANVTAPTGLKIQVNPSILRFTYIGQRLSFSVTVEGSLSAKIVSGSLVWDDGVHQVRSPIAVFSV